MARVIYIASFPPRRGGGALSALQIATGLAGRGHEMTLLGPILEAAVGQPDELAGRVPGVRVERFAMPHFQPDPYHSTPVEYVDLQWRRIRERLCDLLEQRPPDLLIAGNERLLAGVPAFARRRGIPCLALARGILSAVLDGSFDPEVGRRMLEQIRRADRVVAVAEHLAARLRAHGVQDVHAIPNAVDSRAFRPAPPDPGLRERLGLAPGAPVVVHVSNLKTVKRPLDLVASARQTVREVPDLVYLIVGDGFQREVMEQAVRDASLERSFRFVGWVPHEQVPAYLRLADLVVLPSQTEGMARAYLEAQACGVTVLASDIPAAREVIVDGVSGRLFTRADVADLSRQTLSLIRDPAARAAIGARARDSVLRSHVIDDALARYDGHVADLLADRQRTTRA